MTSRFCIVFTGTFSETIWHIKFNIAHTHKMLSLCMSLLFALHNHILLTYIHQLHIYTIICLKSVCLSGDVRRITLAIVAQSPREMSQTDRIHPRYFLLQIRVSIRRRIFLYA